MFCSSLALASDFSLTSAAQAISTPPSFFRWFIWWIAMAPAPMKPTLKLASADDGDGDGDDSLTVTELLRACVVCARMRSQERGGSSHSSRRGAREGGHATRRGRGCNAMKERRPRGGWVRRRRANVGAGYH